ncbi:ceramide glucosyltransferase [Agrobacterium larrymoorei]|uniref:ceramide glucosyltransferase n=1 Tax=Agrobacterium larrymoorei TaxID=160699 RepID=UPI0030BD69A8
MDIALAVLAVALILVHLLSIALTVYRVRPKPKRVAAQHTQPPVSLVIPLRGVENFTAMTIPRAFQLDWPNYEILFCVADATDPVIPHVKSNIAAFPHIRATLLLGDDRVSANPKLNNCVKGWRAAASEWVILADSNVLMPHDYIATLMGAWRKDSGLVCSPPLGSRPADIWSELECTFLNTFQCRYQYAAETLGQGFAQGKTMLWNKPLLDSLGGIEALGAEIAEDAAATKLIRASGRSVHLAPAPFEQPLGKRSFAEIWSRQARWARLRRVTFPHFFAPEILVGGIPPLVLTVMAAVLFGADEKTVVALTAAVLGLFYVPELALAKLKGWHVSWTSFPAMIMRDALLPLIWARSWIGSSVSWRGNMMTVGTQESTLSG